MSILSTLSKAVSLPVRYTASMEFRLGTIGWSYPDWKGTFCPAGTKDELAYYATQFDAVEVDNTFYRMPTARMVESWYRRAPEGFLFCPKLPGEITHDRQLEEVDELIAEFARVIAGLREKLGPILIQLSPSLTSASRPLLEHFLTALPRGYRYTVEPRHRSWLKDPELLPLLRSLDMAITLAHHPWYPRFTEATTDFTYLRLLGKRDVFPDFSRVYEEKNDALLGWVSRLHAFPATVRRSYVFANNQFEGHSPGTMGRVRAALRR